MTALNAKIITQLLSVSTREKPNDFYEKMQLYYHPDHLGSSSYITNLDGEVMQHIEYVPYGEVFIDELELTRKLAAAGKANCNNTWNTPYRFNDCANEGRGKLACSMPSAANRRVKLNAKELDEETGMYYYGARYYEPRQSLWMSVDNEQESHPNVSTYTYCLNNPVLFTDPDGKGVWTKLGKALVKVGTKVGKYDFKALSQIATYTTAFSDVLENVNTLTDKSSSGWDKLKAGASLASELLPVSVGDVKDAYNFVKGKGPKKAAEKLIGAVKASTKGQAKGSLSGTKEALREAKKRLKLSEGETLPKTKGRLGAPMRGDSRRSYRLDPVHPNARPGSGEEFPHINYWGYTKGKRGRGGQSGAIPIKK